MNKIVIVVRDGMVQDVFSKEDCIVDVIDLDVNDDYDEKERLEDRADDIRNSNEYKCVY